MDRNTRFKELVKLLARFGLECRSGKGSEVVVKGKGRIHVIGCHGSNHEIPKQVISNLRRKFDLRPENNVPDAEFYGEREAAPAKKPSKKSDKPAKKAGRRTRG